jgi:hypothetical protein
MNDTFRSLLRTTLSTREVFSAASWFPAGDAAFCSSFSVAAFQMRTVDVRHASQCSAVIVSYYISGVSVDRQPCFSGAAQAIALMY